MDVPFWWLISNKCWMHVESGGRSWHQRGRTVQPFWSRPSACADRQHITKPPDLYAARMSVMCWCSCRCLSRGHVTISKQELMLKPRKVIWWDMLVFHLCSLIHWGLCPQVSPPGKPNRRYAKRMDTVDSIFCVRHLHCPYCPQRWSRALWPHEQWEWTCLDWSHLGMHA